MVGTGYGEPLKEYKWVRTDPNNSDAVPVPPGLGWALYEPLTYRDRGYFTYWRPHVPPPSEYQGISLSPTPDEIREWLTTRGYTGAAITVILKSHAEKIAAIMKARQAEIDGA